MSGQTSSGQTIVIKGDITGSEDLTIAGRVEGRINIAGRVLTLAAGSKVEGEVHAGTVVVSGEVDGEITATARLDIRNTARVGGHLSAPRLAVADGAHISATVEMPAREPEKQKLAVAV